MYVSSFLLVAGAALVSSAATEVDICKIMDCTDTGSEAATPITTKPTPTVTKRPKPDVITPYPNENQEGCLCVPYYLCDKGVAAYANNCTVTGWGELDIRFDEGRTNPCKEVVTKCCENPLNVNLIAPPTPGTCGQKGCGYRNSKGLDFTLKGGTGDEALFGEFPWVIELLDASGSNYLGGGVLIHPQVVMTAAHKVDNFTKTDGNQLLIRAGEWDRKTTKERLPYQDRLVKEVLVHPEYKPGVLWNNVALLKLDVPVQLDEHINVICLPSQDESLVDKKKCITNGWGKRVLSGKASYADILKKVEQDIVPYETCQVWLKRTRLGRHYELHNSFICSGGEEGKDTCLGDGGAPLVCPIGDERYKLTGLVSWGIGCKGKELPAMSANVAKYRNWVDNAMVAWGYDTSVYKID